MVARLNGVVLMVLLAGLGVAGLLRADFSGSLRGGFVDGATQEALEDAFDDALPHRATSEHIWTSIWFGLFRETAEGAVAGKSGWLFTDEEYRYDEQADDRLAENLDLIVGTAATLEDRGITLIVALLPDKARIYPEHLARPRPTGSEMRFDRSIEVLAPAGLNAPDLRDALLAAKAEGPTFLARDTHWTPLGAQRVAAVLAPMIAAEISQLTSYEITPAADILRRGDLMSFVDTGPFADWFGLTPETVAQFDVFPVSDGLGLFDEQPPVEVVLVGTSYSADPTWGFADFLRYELGADVLDLSKSGVGPFVPMQEFLDNDMESEEAVTVVVWEIPERYLTLVEY